jgi:hypothetical protein
VNSKFICTCYYFWDEKLKGVEDESKLDKNAAGTTHRSLAAFLPSRQGNNNPQIQVLSEIKGAVFGHSLFDHDFGPTANVYTATGSWLGVLAEASNTESSFGLWFGQIVTQNDNWENVWLGPPTEAQNTYPTNTQPFWPSGAFGEQNFTDILIMASNFEPYDTSPQAYLPRTRTLLDRISAYYPNARYWIYAHWPEPNIVSSEFVDLADLSDEEFTLYNQYTSGEFWDWHAGWFEEINLARPSLDLRIIPVGPLVADLVENQAVLSTVGFTDLYLDDAPHGNANAYFLAALATYHSMYRQDPDTSQISYPLDAPTLLTEISNNLADISQYLRDRLRVYVDYRSHPR